VYYMMYSYSDRIASHFQRLEPGHSQCCCKSGRMDVTGQTLDSASIVGTLPPEIGNLSNLVILSLTGNPGLTGPIPAEIANLTSLQIL
jgi:hypothetical protein